MAAIELPHASRTRGTTRRTPPRTPARGTAALTRRLGGAREAIRHVQAQSQEPEQRQDMVVPGDDKKVKSWGQTLDATFLIFHLFLLKNCATC